ncbi:MAG: hypothetical protein ACD_43C00011G0002 [uncultured bacterium]|nr:MAG: hypothetical protein ACD_43C00011G0002 [uncultured bacterium]
MHPDTHRRTPDVVRKAHEARPDSAELPPAALIELQKKGYTVNLDRLAQRTVATHVLRYGALAPDHPAQQQAETFLRQSRRKLPDGIRLIVMPEFREANAFAVGKDTVMVSLPLMTKQCSSHEGLIGILGHEAGHIEGADTTRRLNIPGDDRTDLGRLASTYLATTSVRRVAEYRADIQGGIARLDEAGVNPLGYILELEHFHEQEITVQAKEKIRNDAVHGSNLDRALLGRLSMRYFDYSHLSAAVTTITDEERAAWAENTTSDFNCTTELFNEYVSAREYAKHIPRCLEILNKLPRRQRIAATAELIEFWQNHGIPRIVGETFKKFFIEVQKIADVDCAESLAEPLAKAPLTPTHRFLYEALYLDLPVTCSNVVNDGLGNPVSYKDWYEATQKTWLTTIQSPADLVAARAGLAVVAEVDIASAPGSVTDLQSYIVDAAIDKKLFGDIAKPDFDLTSCLAEVGEWSVALAEFSAKKGILVYSSDYLFWSAKRQLIDRATISRRADVKLFYEQVQAVELAQRVMLVSQEAQTVFVDKVTHDARLREAMRLFERNDSASAQVGLKKIDAMLADHVISADTRELGWFMVGIAHEVGFSADEYNSGQIEAVTHVSIVKELRIKLETALATRPMFAGLLPIEREIISGLFVNTCNLGEGIINKNDSELVKAAENNFRGRDHLLLQHALASGLADQGVAKRIAKLLLTHGAEYGVEKYNLDFSRDSALGVRYMVAYLLRCPIGDWLNIIDAYEASSIPVTEEFTQQRRLIAPLVEKYFKTTKNAEPERSVAEVSRIADWCYDPDIRLQLFAYCSNQRWTQASTFSEKVDLAFSDPTTKTDLAIKDRLIEEEMFTQEQYNVVVHHFCQQMDVFFSEGSAAVGIVAQVEGYVKLDPAAALKQVKLLISTRHSDKSIREQIGSRIREGVLLSANKMSDDIGPTIYDKELNKQQGLQESQSFLNRADEILQLLYGLGEEEKLFLAKKLLLDSGVMAKAEHRRELFTVLLDETLQTGSGSKDLEQTLRQVTAALAETTDWKTLFLGIAQTVARNLAIPPTTSTEWSSCDSVRGSVPAKDLIYFEQRSLAKMPPGAEETPWLFEDRYNTRSSQAGRLWLGSHEQRRELHNQQYAPLELILEVAPRLGAMAVRFLQLMPEFVEVAPIHQDAFNTVYDGMRGQSKLASISVVDREWSQERGTMWNGIRSFGKRLGGGSLMTVYEIETSESQSGVPDRVIRVRNPNIKFHLDATRKLFTETIDAMKKNGAIDAATHTKLTQGVEMVYQWVCEELDFTGFLEKDASFKAAQDGYGREQGFAYGMYVPKSEPPLNSYFQIEEKIEGKNLTEWDALMAEGHDMKQVTSLIVQNYVEQIKQGRIHGDVHIGNYRVTSDQRIAILDRTFFIELSELEQTVAKSVVTGELNIPAITTYIESLVPAGSKVTLPDIFPELMALGTGLQQGERARVNKALLSLRGKGIPIPLKISLLLRNINGLDRLAKKSGLTGFAAALAYSPTTN